MADGGKMKLIYFNARGLAELTRLILAEAGAEYEDVRISREVEWPELKQIVPFSQLPCLEYKGEKITQSLSIARFVAREFKLSGKDNWEAAKADMIVDGMMDLIPKIIAIMRETDESKKPEMVEAFKNENVENFLKNMDNILEKNGGGEFLVGKSLTYADIAVANSLTSLEGLIGIEWKQKHPKVAALTKSVLERPNIKKWIEVRPVTER